MSFSQLTSWFDKISWLDKKQYLVALIVASGLLLFLPDQAKSALGLLGFVESQKGSVGAIFVLSLSLLTSPSGFSLYEKIWSKISKAKQVKAFISELDNLSPSEKGVLKYFLDNDEKAMSLSMQNEAVNCLEKRGMIVKLQAGNAIAFPYMVQPSIFFHLKSHPEKLESAKEYRGNADKFI